MTVRLLAAVAVAMGAFGVVSPLAPGRAGADEPAGGALAFSGAASAQGVRATYAIPSYILVDTLADGGAPVAQAVLESSGLARGFGSLPYPGDLIVTLPGTVAGLGPAGTPKLPDYPLFAQADYPAVPTARFSDPAGGLSLTATASPTNVLGAAKAGIAGVAASAATTATVLRKPDGTVVATATSVTHGINLNAGLVRIAEVKGESVTTLKPDGRLTTSRTLDITGATVGGQNVLIGPHGITLGSQSTPVPVDEMTKSLNDALSSAGVSLKLLTSETVKGGGSSDVLLIQTRQTIPLPGNPTGLAAYRIGGATTSILTGVGVLVAPSVQVGAGSPGPSVAAGGGSAVPGGAAGSLDSTAAGLGGPASAPLASGLSAPTPSNAAVGAVDTSATARRPTRLVRDVRSNVRFFYAILAAGGGFLLASSSLWRNKGVQAQWTF